MKFIPILICLILNITKSIAQEELKHKIDDIFESYFQKANTEMATLQVYSPSKGIDISIGKSRQYTTQVSIIKRPFYTASITKMLTAVSIGLLHEGGQLNFEDQIDEYLPASMIKGLHPYEGKDYSKDISIAHLLQHRSGLPDYFTDETLDKSPNIINQILLNKDKFWSPQELIQFTKDKMKPHFAPGDGLYYSDTGYVLLALIIEKVSGLSLDEFFKKFIFSPLNMKSSYVNLKSKSIENKLSMANFYAGEFEVSRFKSLSADWGGGGAVSTTQDLIQFLKAYHENELLQEQTRLQMQDWVYETHGMTYGFGVRKVSFQELFQEDTSLEIIGHTGSTASFLWYCPQLDTYVAGTLNQLEASKPALIMVREIFNSIQTYK